MLAVSAPLFCGVLLCAGASPVATATSLGTRSVPELKRSLLADVQEQGPYRLTPERRALLNTIRYAEGTWTDGENKGYRILYGLSLIHI